MFFRKGVVITRDVVPVTSFSLDTCHIRVSKSREVEDADGDSFVLQALQADLDANRTQIMYFKTEGTQKNVLKFLLAR